MSKLLLDPDENPCDANTEYKSVIITGAARLVEDSNTKCAVLKKVVAKYTPHLAAAVIPDNMLNGTAVICIDVQTISGKYYA